MKPTLYLASLSVLSLSLTACGEGPATVRLSLSGFSDTVAPPAPGPSGLNTTDADGSAVTIESAYAYVRDIEFDLPEASEGCDIEGAELSAPVICENDKVVVEGPFVFDLITGDSTPSLEEVTLPEGTYKRIDVRLEDADTADGLVLEDDAMNETSLLARGTVVVEGEILEFGLALKFNEDARFERPEGIEVSGNGGELSLHLDVATWFEGVDLAGCLASGDVEVSDGGVYWIDEDVSGGDCSSIEGDLKENIKTSGQIDGE